MPQIRFFLGANAPSGFYSLYDQLLPPEQAESLYILKGGPGCGKSTLLTHVAQALEDHGLAVEYILCSGDPDSLDAIAIPALHAAVVDGTAPHVVEPTCPGALDHYVNLGAFYDRAGLKNVRPALTETGAAYHAAYQRAYRCLNAAAQVGADSRSALLTPALSDKMARRVKGILSREVKKHGERRGCCVNRFLDAVTCRGAVCEFATVDSLCKRVYELADSYGLAHELLTLLADGAISAGWDVIACPDPMAPERLKHLLIPGLELAFVTSTPALPYPKHPYRRVRVDAMVDETLLRRYKPRLRFSRKVAAALLDEGVESLAQAKTAHDTLETLYHPWVDFAQADAMAETIVNELLALV